MLPWRPRTVAPGVDATQWSACVRTRPPRPHASRVCCPVCSRHMTRCTWATTDGNPAVSSSRKVGLRRRGMRPVLSESIRSASSKFQMRSPVLQKSTATILVPTELPTRLLLLRAGRRHQTPAEPRVCRQEVMGSTPVTCWSGRQALVTRGKGATQPPSAQPPRPRALGKHGTRTRIVSLVWFASGALWSLLEILGHDQP
jgi:hypothetical protein